MASASGADPSRRRGRGPAAMRAAPLDLKRTIRGVPDFPKQGVYFYDVSTLFRDARALSTVIEQMSKRFSTAQVDAIAGIEARGLILGSALAVSLGVGLILVRKQGKLPAAREGESYALEYGEARIEVHRDAIAAGQRVLVVDDLLATGGTAAATGRLIERLGGSVAGYAFMVELGFLAGRERLSGPDVFSLIRYDAPGPD